MLRMPFSIEEYKERLEKTRQKMTSLGLDALILTKPDNIFYVSGYGASTISTSIGPLHALVVPAKGEPRLITRLVEEATVAETQWTKEPRLHRDDEDPFNLLVGILQESGNTSGMIGIEKNFVTVRQMERMRQVLPSSEFNDATGLVESVSARPSKTESDYARKAAEVTNIGFRRGIEVVREGVYIYEVVGEIDSAMFKAGQGDLIAGSQIGRRTPRTLLWAGPRGGCVHETTTSKRLEREDLVTTEIWGSHNHYVAAAQGTIYIGDSPSTDIVSTYKLLSDMYLAARDTIRAGIRSGEPYDAANRIYRASQGVDYYRAIGWSVGLGMGATRLFKGGEDVITVGLPLFIQAGIFAPLCVICAGTVIVTETGSEEVVTPLLELTMKK